MTQPIRVAVANRHRLMRALLLETIKGQPDIEAVAEIPDEKDIGRIVNEMNPEFLIITLDHPNRPSAICDSLLRQHPGMKILALAPEHNSGIFVWASFNIHTREVEASEEGILSTLRSEAKV
ncbi:MAG: hypothetical protein ACRD4Y_06590 [Candidatus Acidiferrales bacterium]